MTKGKLKAYVIGCGSIYGAGENPLHHWFMSAWHNAKFLPIYGTGKNVIPTVYIQDLAKIIQNVMDVPPKMQRYIIAVDPVLCQQDQIAKAISRVLGSGRVKRVAEEDIYLNKELTTFQADELLLDLKIQSAFALENFNMEFSAEDGMDTIINKVCNEYKLSRNLQPLKVCITGPPASGKSTIGRQISVLYRLNHFTKDDLIKTTLELLKETAGENTEGDTQGLEIDQEEEIREEARNILAEVDDFLGRTQSSSGHDPSVIESDHEAALSTAGGETGGSLLPQLIPKQATPPERDVTKLSDEVFIRLVRWRLLTNQCQNQGYVLDGFPENLNQAKLLFAASDEILEASGEEAEDGRDVVDQRLVPDRVVVLEASDEFLTQRLQSVPAAQVQGKHKDKSFSKALQDFREMNSVYESTLLYYLDLQEILYSPIDITTGDGYLMQNIIGKLMDMLGKPRNYGLTLEEEEALKNSQNFEKSKVEEAEKEDLAMIEIESRELEERWENSPMEKFDTGKRKELEREEAVSLKRQKVEELKQECVARCESLNGNVGKRELWDVPNEVLFKIIQHLIADGETQASGIRLSCYRFYELEFDVLLIKSSSWEDYAYQQSRRKLRSKVKDFASLHALEKRLLNKSLPTPCLVIQLKAEMTGENVEIQMYRFLNNFCTNIQRLSMSGFSEIQMKVLDLGKICTTCTNLRWLSLMDLSFKKPEEFIKLTDLPLLRNFLCIRVPIKIAQQFFQKCKYLLTLELEASCLDSLENPFKFIKSAEIKLKLVELEFSQLPNILKLPQTVTYLSIQVSRSIELSLLFSSLKHLKFLKELALCGTPRDYTYHQELYGINELKCIRTLKLSYFWLSQRETLTEVVDYFGNIKFMDFIVIGPQVDRRWDPNFNVNFDRELGFRHGFETAIEFLWDLAPTIQFIGFEKVLDSGVIEKFMISR